MCKFAVVVVVGGDDSDSSVAERQQAVTESEKFRRRDDHRQSPGRWLGFGCGAHARSFGAERRALFKRQ